MTYFQTTQAAIEFRETRNNSRKHNSEPVIYKRFAASKISDSVKPMTVVEFTDLLGRKHRIPVRNKRQMREAQEFLAMFKKEVAEVNAIVNEYNWSCGRIAEADAIDCMNELFAYGLTENVIKRIIGW